MDNKWGKLLERSFPHTPFKNFMGKVMGKIGMNLRHSIVLLPQAREPLPTRSADNETLSEQRENFLQEVPPHPF
jgi:hypothetical protein